MFRFRPLPGRFQRFAGLPSLNFVRFYKRMTTEAVIDKRIPDKWRDYKPCGVPIRGERIIAFKTPLSNRYDNESDLDNGIKPFERFTPMDLLNHLNQKDLKLGLVVDFTNTNRYYSGEEFRDHGILYRKIKCVGKEIPNENVVTRFKIEVSTFLAENTTGALVGVHCTHGLNRAGYIVCRYLIECRGYTPEKAIEAFNEARGYPMERENYLQDLKTKEPKADGESYRRRKRASPSDRPRFIHTSAESFTRHISPGEDIERKGRRSSHYNRRENKYLDCGVDDRYGTPDYHTQTRNYTSRRFSTRERKDNNYRDYHNYDNKAYHDYHNYDNHDNAYHNYDNSYHTSYDYRDYRPVRSREGSYRQDNVMRNKSYSSRDRPRPYSHHRTRKY